MDEDGLTLEKAADLAVVKWKWLVDNPRAGVHDGVPLASLRYLKDGCGWCQYSEEVTGVPACRGAGPKRCDVCPLRDDDVRDACCNEWEAGDRKAMLLRVSELQLSVKAQLAWEKEQHPRRPFKVGDVVRIRQDAGDKSVYDGDCLFAACMASLRGTEFEIVGVNDYDSGKEHNQRIHHAGWCWVPDWLELVDLSNPPELEQEYDGEFFPVRDRTDEFTYMQTPGLAEWSTPGSFAGECVYSPSNLAGLFDLEISHGFLPSEKGSEWKENEDGEPEDNSDGFRYIVGPRDGEYDVRSMLRWDYLSCANVDNLEEALDNARTNGGDKAYIVTGYPEEDGDDIVLAPAHGKPYGWVYHNPESVTHWDGDRAETYMESESHGLVHPVDEDCEWDWEYCTIATFWPWPEGFDEKRRRIILEENESGEFEVVEE